MDMSCATVCVVGVGHSCALCDLRHELEERSYQLADASSQRMKAEALTAAAERREQELGEELEGKEVAMMETQVGVMRGEHRGHAVLVSPPLGVSPPMTAWTGSSEQAKGLLAPLVVLCVSLIYDI